MTSIMAVGIKEYSNKDLVEIPCAYEDATKIYDTFKEVLGEELSEYSSLCIANVKTQDFRNLINIIKSTLKKDDTLIIYYSGHGTIHTSLALNFTDGHISISEIKPMFEEVPFDVILILDCCYSGLAWGMTEINDTICTGNISVITAANTYTTTKYTDEKSEFTENFCNTVLYLNENITNITICGIQDKMKENNQECYVNIKAGVGDVTLLKVENKKTEYEDVALSFKRLIDTKESSVKEMLYYSLENYPSRLRLDIIVSMWESFKVEGNWLVRRAIGSVLANCNGVENEKRKLVVSGLSSQNWMIKCIVVIAVRYDVKNYNEDMKKIIQDKKEIMDLVWLANLYFTDEESRELAVSLNSNLALTEWGILDIFRGYCKFIDPQQLYDKIVEAIGDKKLLNKLNHEMILNPNITSDLEDSDIEELAMCKITECLYSYEERGRTKKNKKDKWVFSNLFGSWRGFLQAPMKEYFENSQFEVIDRELSIARALPRYEMRMAIFQYLLNDEEYSKKYANSIIWGLEDEHPWVRREAVAFFCKYNLDCKECKINIDIDKSKYPGIIDYYICLLRNSLISYKQIEETKVLTDIEMKSIKRYIPYK